MSSTRADLARASWDHLQACRALARDQLSAGDPEHSGVSVDSGASGDPEAAARWIGDEGRQLARTSPTRLPRRLTAGNIGAAVAGEVIAPQHELLADQRASLASRLRDLLSAGGDDVAGTVEVCVVDHLGVGVVYYRRRTCCLRDRLDGHHRCDTCSLRDPADLDEMVVRAIDRRYGTA